MDVDNSLSETKVYMWVLYMEYSCENGVLKKEAGAHIPTVITAKKNISTNKNGLITYELKEYWTPRDGSYNTTDIKEKFPRKLWSKALDSQLYIDKQNAKCENAAKEYFNSMGSYGITDSDIKVSSVGSDLSNVNIDVISISKNSDNQLIIKVRWNNNSDKIINYGNPFKIAKLESKKWVELKTDGYWELPAYPVLPLSTEDTDFRDTNREREFNISAFYDIKNGETYKFSTEFCYDNDGTKKYNVWVEFSYNNEATVGGVSGPQSVVFTENLYKFKSDKDMATLSISTTDNKGSFRYSLLSSYMAYGTYEDNGKYIVLTTNDGKFKYTFKKENDTIKFIANKSSKLPSYAYSSGAKAETCVPDGATFEKVEPIYINTIDNIVFDIDKDGNDETCVLGYGPTSGLFTFTLSVSENGKMEYFNIYNSPFYHFSFDVKNGVLQLKAMTQGENPETTYFDFVIEAENIVLKKDNENIEYWGEQGLDSPYAPKSE